MTEAHRRFSWREASATPTPLLRSDDAGLTWVRLNDPRLRFGWISALTGDPRVAGRVYVGTGGRGIFVGEPVGR